MVTSTVQTRAEEAASHFETARRGDDPGAEIYIRTKDGTPEWVRNLVYAAHHGLSDYLPDDYRYASTLAALEWIANSDNPEDEGPEFADATVDVYTGALFAWLATNLTRQYYCDEAASEYGPFEEITNMVQAGQAFELQEIYGLVLAYLEGLES